LWALDALDTATPFSRAQSVERWKNDIDAKVVRGDGTPIPALLLGSKVRSRLCDEV
jgi:hypothetical protein